MKTLFTLVAGILLGAIAFGVFNTFDDGATDSENSNSNEPLYWVAPMDPNFRRDKPGKSPMGMDLVPVYAEDQGEESPGTVKISPDVENNLGVSTTKVERRTLSVPIHTVGYVGYNEDQLVHIHPRVSGWVETLSVKTSGEQVTKGQPLYSLYSPQLVNAQEEYLLAKSRKNRALIDAAIARLRALHLPEAVLSDLDKNGKIHQRVTFTSPQSGVIDNLNIREGFFVEPGTTMMSIGTLQEVWVEAEVFERQSSKIKTGLAVSMTLDYLPGREWQGEVDYVYPSLDPKTRTLRVRLRFQNPDIQLKPNMFAQVKIHTAPLNNVLMVPIQAVIRTGKQDRVVLSLGEGKYKSVEVRIGLITSDAIQILDGLVHGDQIVTSAQFLLDSESSIDSDFRRMHNMGMSTHDETVQQADVTGVIVQLDKDARSANISRSAIPKWGRGPATMDFMFAQDLDMAELTEGSAIAFTFEIRDGEFVVTHATVTENNQVGGED